MLPVSWGDVDGGDDDFDSSGSGLEALTKMVGFCLWLWWRLRGCGSGGTVW